VEGVGVTSLGHDPIIYMEMRKKSRQNPGRTGRDFNLEPSNTVTEFLFANSDWKLKLFRLRWRHSQLLTSANIGTYLPENKTIDRIG
jgi:hypothetical protein